MRNLILSALLLASAFQTANAQLMIQWSINGQPAVASLEVPERLNQGDVCIMNFANLPYAGFNKYRIDQGEALVIFTFASAEQSSTKELRMEVFNALNPNPIWQIDASIGPNHWMQIGDPLGLGRRLSDGLDPWQDNQGVVKLTMLEGSLSMVGMSLAVRTADSLYEFTAVPEPSSLSLLALGGVVLVLGVRKN